MSERLPVQLASRQLGLKCVVRPESRFDPTVIRSQVLPTRSGARPTAPRSK